LTAFKVTLKTQNFLTGRNKLKIRKTKAICENVLVFEFLKLPKPFSTQEQGCHSLVFEVHISNFVLGMHFYSIFVMITIACLL